MWQRPKSGENLPRRVPQSESGTQVFKSNLKGAGRREKIKSSFQEGRSALDCVLDKIESQIQRGKSRDPNTISHLDDKSLRNLEEPSSDNQTHQSFHFRGASASSKYRLIDLCDRFERLEALFKKPLANYWQQALIPSMKRNPSSPLSHFVDLVLLYMKRKKYGLFFTNIQRISNQENLNLRDEVVWRRRELKSIVEAGKSDEKQRFEEVEISAFTAREEKNQEDSRYLDLNKKNNDRDKSRPSSLVHGGALVHDERVNKFFQQFEDRKKQRNSSIGGGRLQDLIAPYGNKHVDSKSFLDASTTLAPKIKKSILMNFDNRAGITNRLFFDNHLKDLNEQKKNIETVAKSNRQSNLENLLSQERTSRAYVDDDKSLASDSLRPWVVRKKQITHRKPSQLPGDFNPKPVLFNLSVTGANFDSSRFQKEVRKFKEQSMKKQSKEVLKGCVDNINKKNIFYDRANLPSSDRLASRIERLTSLIDPGLSNKS